MFTVRHALPWLLPLLLVACGPAATAAQTLPRQPLPTSAARAPSAVPTAASDPAPSLSTAPEATPIATPTPAPPAPQPDFLFVSFAGMASGTYPVHLHRVCSGTQGYHLAYLPYLDVSEKGSGGIAVPAADFGHGWCLIVYANRAAKAVAAYRPI